MGNKNIIKRYSSSSPVSPLIFVSRYRMEGGMGEWIPMRSLAFATFGVSFFAFVIQYLPSPVSTEMVSMYVPPKIKSNVCAFGMPDLSKMHHDQDSYGAYIRYFVCCDNISSTLCWSLTLLLHALVRCTNAKHHNETNLFRRCQVRQSANQSVLGVILLEE